MNKLARIRFTAGCTGEGYQETDANGKLLRIYDVDGEQFDPGVAEWEFVREVGEVEPGDSDAFWEAIERDGAEVRVP